MALFCKLAKLPRGRTIRTTSPSEMKAGRVTQNAVIKWCRNHPQFAVVVGSSGAGHMDERTLLFATRRFGRVFMEYNKDLCIINVIVNGIFAFRGEVDALSAKEKLLKEVVVGGSLASVALDISNVGLHLNLHCITHPNVK